MFDIKGNPTTETVQDPNTGEIVQKVKVPEAMVKEITERMAINNNVEKQYIMRADAFFGALNDCMLLRQNVANNTTELHKVLQTVCKKMGLTKDNWIYNISEKHMELRQPPVVKEDTIK